MTDLVPFRYNDHPVRTVQVDGNTWFVAADICAVLSIRNVSDAMTRLDDDEKSFIALTDGTPGNPNRAIVSEAGLYGLIIRSDKPEARPFRRWVTHDVLPAVRATGTYSAAPASSLDVLAATIAELQRIERQVVRAELTAGAAQATADDVAHRVNALEGNHGWYSALAYASRNGLRTDVDSLNALGRRAGQIGRANGIEPAKVPHPHYGQVNGWPENVWRDATGDPA